MKQTDPLLRDIYKYIEENIRAKKPGNDPNASLRVDFLNYDYQHAFKSLEDKVIKKHWLEAENIMSKYHIRDRDYFVQIIAPLAFGDFVNETNRSFENLEKLLKDIEEVKSIIFIGTGTSLEAELGWILVKTCLYSCLNGVCTHEQVDREYDTDGRGGGLWKRLESEERIEAFKNLFSKQAKGKDAQKIHGYLREFIKKGKVEHLVCFNWDNLIEREQNFNVNIYGGSVNNTGGGTIWKPCGCVTRTDLPWVFPHKEEEVTEILNRWFVKHVDRSQPRVVIVMGYSGRGNPKFTKNYLHSILGNIHIYDVRPEPIENDDAVLGDFFIGLGATFVFKQIFKKLGYGEVRATKFE